MNVQKILSDRIHQALTATGLNINCKEQVRKINKSEFGDYQFNGALVIAKHLNMSARTLAEMVVNCLDLSDIAYKIKIVDPGFINIFLNLRWLENQLASIISSPRLGVGIVIPQTIVVDYSSPNIAKEMHVGHIRSTIIGDALVRTLHFLGHRVIKANHLGDWGTPFGMLIAYFESIAKKNKKEVLHSSIDNLYHSAKKHYDKDPDFATCAHRYVAKLQSGDKSCYKIWRKLVRTTVKNNQKIYEQLNVTLKPKDIIGESFYKDMLPEVIQDLKEKKIAVEVEGAVLVFLEEFKNRQNEPMGVTLQKKDGSYLYTTTDIACVKYRCEQLKANRIIYCTDSRQHQHFRQVWTIARQAGYVPQSVSLEHHMFGMILGEDGKPFKTRCGKIIKLASLLDMAKKRARRLISNKSSSLSIEQAEKLAQILSVGAIKYADLSKNRTTDYVFHWDNILSFEGNTAPYIQYAYTRIISIFERSKYSKKQLTGNISLLTEYEVRLAICLLQFEEIITTVAHKGMPHILCNYLYNLSALFSSFYEHCPILNTENEVVRRSRLQIALLTARTLKQGLNLLGIKTVKKM